MLWPAVIVAALIGFAGLAISLRGRRIDSAPICRRCRFNLSGLYPATSTCPECGASLSGPRTVRIGQRRRPRGILVGSAVLLLAAAAAEGRSNNPATADTALAELNARLAAKELTRAQRDLILTRALELQADPAAPWRPGWGDFVETLWLDGALTDEQQQRYARGAAIVSLQCRPRVRRNDIAPVSIIVLSRAGTLRVLEARLRIVGARLGAQTLGVGLHGCDTPLASGSPVGMPGLIDGPVAITRLIPDPFGDGDRVDTPIDLPEGVHDLRCRLEVSIHRCLPNSLGYVPSAMSRGGTPRPAQGKVAPPPWAEDPAWADGPPAATDEPIVRSDRSRNTPPIVAWRSELTAQVEVLPPDAANPELIADESLRPQIESSIAGVQAFLASDHHGPLGYGYITPWNPPLDLAFDVFWRVGDREFALGMFTLDNDGPHEPRHPPYGTHFATLHDFPETADTVDVIFRTSPAAARRTIGIERIWDGQIIVEGVPLKKRGR